MQEPRLYFMHKQASKVCVCMCHLISNGDENIEAI